MWIYHIIYILLRLHLSPTLHHRHPTSHLESLVFQNSLRFVSSLPIRQLHKGYVICLIYMFVPEPKKKREVQQQKCNKICLLSFFRCPSSESWCRVTKIESQILLAWLSTLNKTCQSCCVHLLLLFLANACGSLDWRWPGVNKHKKRRTTQEKQQASLTAKVTKPEPLGLALIFDTSSHGSFRFEFFSYLRWYSSVGLVQVQQYVIV